MDIRKISPTVFSLFGTVVFLALFATTGAQNPVGSQSVLGSRQASGAQVVINQIDTSAFPKVTIFATVSKNGAPLKGLSAADFRVREDEVDQEPLTVAAKLTPLNAVLALDVSGSMKRRMADAKAAAASFIDMLETQDRAQVISFAGDVKVLSADGDRQRAKIAIQSAEARGTTALYDALYTSVEMLKGVGGRKAIALLSDGADDDGTQHQLSKHSVDDALALARVVNVPIYAIGVGTEIDEPLLKKVATQTGGRCLIAPQPSQLKEMYGKIGEELSGQYSIFYTSNLPGDGSEHRVQLTFAGVTGMKEYKSPMLAQPTPTPKPEPPAPTPTPTPTAPAKLNLFTSGYSEVIACPGPEWEKWLNTGNSALYFAKGPCVFGFKGGRSATFDSIRIRIVNAEPTTIKTLELAAGDNPAGPFKKVTVAEPMNLKMVQTDGWQEFKFEPVTAMFYSMKLTANGSNLIACSPGTNNAVEILGELGAVSAQQAPVSQNPNQVNLFTPGCSEVIAAPNKEWEKWLTTGKVSLYFGRGIGIFGFKGGKSATFDTVKVRILDTDGANIKTLELGVGESPAGPFRKVTSIEPLNLKLVKSDGWQEFKFQPVTAKFYSIKLTSVRTGVILCGPTGGKNSIQILGELR